MIARVVVDHCRGRRFDYLVPAELSAQVSRGARVRVPFGSREALGTVVDFAESPEIDRTKLKPLHGLVSCRAELTPGLLKLVQWLAAYYCCPEELALRTALPQVVRKARVQHKTQRIVALTAPLTPALLKKIKARAPRQLAVLHALEAAGGKMPAPALLATSGAPPSTIVALAKSGLISVSKQVKERDPHAEDVVLPTPHLALNPAQGAALREILRAIEKPSAARPILLHGVTGSGKTEVYLQALAHVLATARTAIVLVPEISLTPQTVERFRSRFEHLGAGVAVLHSHLSEGERHDEWHRIHSKRAKIVIGARSAIFAPLTDLGLIIVDEEHEPSYKQEEAPRYHARDVAVMRGRIENAAVLLGSATPSIESWTNATTGKYTLTSLPERADNAQLPFIRIVDMRQEFIRQKGIAVISSRLCTAIHQRLERREQTILFLNRRGFAAALVCPVCGHVCSCPHCSVALTFHRAQDCLICHFCNHTQPAPRVCPACGKQDIRTRGTGTERVEDVVKKLFPKAVVERMDADSMARKNSYREILGAFRTGKIDILIGTQMIAKGLHFPNVTLVGIINADVALHLADFRAAERTFQLLVQVAGRAGRGDVAGEVFIQSATPFHPAVQFARHHDYAGFVEQEMEFRRACGYPPCGHLILLTIQSANADAALFTAHTLHRELCALALKEVRLSEPVPAPLARLKGEHRFQIMLRGKPILKMTAALRGLLDKMSMPDQVRLTVDVDALQLL